MAIGVAIKRIDRSKLFCAWSAGIHTHAQIEVPFYARVAPLYSLETSIKEGRMKIRKQRMQKHYF